MCFDCGLAWHGNKKCNKAMDKDYLNWAIKLGNVSNCPKCKVRV